MGAGTVSIDADSAPKETPGGLKTTGRTYPARLWGFDANSSRLCLRIKALQLRHGIQGCM